MGKKFLFYRLLTNTYPKLFAEQKQSLDDELQLLRNISKVYLIHNVWPADIIQTKWRLSPNCPYQLVSTEGPFWK